MLFPSMNRIEKKDAAVPKKKSNLQQQEGYFSLSQMLVLGLANIKRDMKI